MKTLSLRPYYGTIYLCESLDEIKAEFERQEGYPYPYEDDPEGGRHIGLSKNCNWLVFAANRDALTHELCHVLLRTFAIVGHNPTQGDGEPFCYMLSTLLQEAAE